MGSTKAAGLNQGATLCQTYINKRKMSILPKELLAWKLKWLEGLLIVQNSCWNLSFSATVLRDCAFGRWLSQMFYKKGWRKPGLFCLRVDAYKWGYNVEDAPGKGFHPHQTWLALNLNFPASITVKSSCISDIFVSELSEWTKMKRWLPRDWRLHKTKPCQ